VIHQGGVYLDAGGRPQVLQDMLQLLKESVSSRHSERLEQIVIVLIGIEIGEYWMPRSTKYALTVCHLQYSGL